MRRRSREIALQLIYELSIRPDQSLEEAIELFPFQIEPAESGVTQEEEQESEQLQTNPDLELGSSEAEEVRQYACELVRGVRESAEELEELLRDNIIGWRPERMVAVDRAAISLALYEGVISKLVPVPVAISEAVELSKAYGTEESSRFVNGVLGRIVRGSKPEAQ